MKYLLIASLIFISTSAICQDCKTYYYLQNNKTIEITIYNKKGEASGKQVYAVSNYQRDGFMQVGENGEANPNYHPNSFDEIIVDENYKEPAQETESNIADWFDRNENDNDHYSQPGDLYRKAMNEQDRKNLVSNIVNSMSGITGDKKIEIINRQLCHFFRADMQLGSAVATGLGITIDKNAMTHAH